MQPSILPSRGLIAALASCWLIAGCSSDDGSGNAGAGDNMSSHADFLSSCVIFAGQCMNYFGAPNAALQDYNSKNCGSGWTRACPLEDGDGHRALGECQDPSGGKYFPSGVSGSLIYYENTNQTPESVSQACEVGGGVWLTEYVP